MTSPLTLVFIITENYLQQAAPFLHSLRLLETIPRVGVCLGWNPPDQLRQTVPYVDFRPMPTHWSADNGIFQHGRWLDALPEVHDDRLYLLSDADIVVQRGFTSAELSHFADYDAQTFGAGWNAYPNDNLQEEARRMVMTDDGTLGNHWQDIPCYNTGLLVMRGRAWKRFRDLWESRCRGFWKLNSHRSRCQWLMNWSLHRLGMRADILPLSLHAHAHHGMPRDVEVRDGVAHYGSRIVLFRHAF